MPERDEFVRVDFTPDVMREILREKETVQVVSKKRRHCGYIVKGDRIEEAHPKDFEEGEK